MASETILIALSLSQFISELELRILIHTCGAMLCCEGPPTPRTGP